LNQIVEAIRNFESRLNLPITGPTSVFLFVLNLKFFADKYSVQMTWIVVAILDVYNNFVWLTQNT